MKTSLLNCAALCTSPALRQDTLKPFDHACLEKNTSALVRCGSCVFATFIHFIGNEYSCPGIPQKHTCEFH